MATGLDKRDLEIILEVNRKSVELETAVAEQNEEIIESLNSISGSITKVETGIHNNLNTKGQTSDSKFQGIDKKIDDAVRDIKKDIADVKKDLESKISDTQKSYSELSKDLFQLKFLLSSGIITLIFQLIQLFRK